MSQKDLQGYPVRDFMRTRLGLSGTALLIYAMIYCFTAYGSGSFWGSRAYIAERVGVSLSSVDRALKRLLLSGYIIKSDDRHLSFKTSVYIANLGILRGCAEAQKAPEETRAPGENPKASEKGERTEKEIAATEIKDINMPGAKEINTPVAKEINMPLIKEKRPHLQECRELLKGRVPNAKEFLNAVLEKYRKSQLDCAKNYGTWTEIILTPRQFDYLTGRWGDDAVCHYIDKLEYYIINNPNRNVRGYFATLNRWLDEDMSINVGKNDV